MGQTLTNGIYLPDEGEVRCYDGLASNWTTIDAVVGGYRAHVANENIHITSAERNKWDNGVSQAYVLRYASTSLTALGTVAFSALDNTDNIKIGDKVLDQDGKLYSVTAVDSANSQITVGSLLIDLSKDSDLSNYYTKGETDTLLNDKADTTALTAHTGNTTIHVTAADKNKWDAVTTKANDTDVVHKAGNEIILGVKSFSTTPYIYNSDVSSSTPNFNLRNSKVTKGTTTDNGSQIIQFLDKDLKYLAQVIGNKLSNGSTAIKFNVGTLDSNAQSISTEIQLYIAVNGEKRFIPSNDNDVSLGRSLNRWKDINTVLINGLTPSSLSMPTDNTANIIDISGYITVLDGSQANTYRAPDNGYIGITMRNCTGIQVYITGFWGNQIVRPTAGALRFFMPICKNMTANILVFGGIVDNARFFPCQGNI